MIAAATSDPAPMGMSSTAGEFAKPEIASNTSATSSDAGTAVAAAAANEGALAPASGRGASMVGVAERHAAMAVVVDRRTRAPAGCTKAAAAKLRSIATKAKTRAITSLLQTRRNLKLPSICAVMIAKHGEATNTPWVFVL